MSETLTTHSGIHGSHALWLTVVNGIIGKTDRDLLLDICCGGTAITRHLNFSLKMGVDVEDHPERAPDFKFHKSEVLKWFIAFEEMDKADNFIFDVSIISDGLEHFTRPDALRVLAGMEAISRLVIVFVPTNDTEITPDSTDPHAHKSSWSPEDFHALGYETNNFPDWHSPQLILGACFAWKRMNNP